MSWFRSSMTSSANWPPVISAVVVSLWNVNDKATADLMTKFYEDVEPGPAPGSGFARSASRDVEAEAMAVSILLGRVHHARRVAVSV